MRGNVLLGNAASAPDVTSGLSPDCSRNRALSLPPSDHRKWIPILEIKSPLLPLVHFPAVEPEGRGQEERGQRREGLGEVALLSAVGAGSFSGRATFPGVLLESAEVSLRGLATGSSCVDSPAGCGVCGVHEAVGRLRAWRASELCRAASSVSANSIAELKMLPGQLSSSSILRVLLGFPLCSDGWRAEHRSHRNDPEQGDRRKWKGSSGVIQPVGVSGGSDCSSNSHRHQSRG
ncbi:uncharacterized protein LOC134357679 [Mobula hypostoma]|uniref:uncharacterized protein LOC134357679 n=1 Tax=Mobula hypostoma TaxID=723540 RepID=UPI002FC2AD26